MDLTCEDYSEKAIVVRGEETKNCKEELKKLGGKYNAKLKNGAGWIFPKKSEDKILAFMAQNKAEKNQVLQTPSNLLISIEKEIKKMSVTERLTFLHNITKLTLLKEEAPIKSKIQSYVVDMNSEDEMSEDNSEDEKPVVRKRLLLNS